jgi:hypothetical protein
VKIETKRSAYADRAKADTTAPGGVPNDSVCGSEELRSAARIDQRGQHAPRIALADAGFLTFF